MSRKIAKKIGSREEVWKGFAIQTSGGLKKSDLVISRRGKIVSKKQSEAAKKRMRSGKGLCEYCISEYVKGNIKYSKKEGQKEIKKETKKDSKKDSKRDSKKDSKKDSKPVYKPARIITGPRTQKRIKELESEIKKLREKAMKLPNPESKQFRDIMQEMKERRKKISVIKKALRQKKKNNT